MMMARSKELESPFVQFRREYCINCDEYKYKGGKEDRKKTCDGYKDDIFKCALTLSLLKMKGR